MIAISSCNSPDVVGQYQIQRCRRKCWRCWRWRWCWRCQAARPPRAHCSSPVPFPCCSAAFPRRPAGRACCQTPPPPLSLAGLCRADFRAPAIRTSAATATAHTSSAGLCCPRRQGQRQRPDGGPHNLQVGRLAAAAAGLVSLARARRRHQRRPQRRAREAPHWLRPRLLALPARPNSDDFRLACSVGAPRNLFTLPHAHTHRPTDRCSGPRRRWRRQPGPFEPTSCCCIQLARLDHGHGAGAPPDLGHRLRPRLCELASPRTFSAGRSCA